MVQFVRVGAALPAQDLARAKSWYAEKLGLKPSEEYPEGSFYDVGSTRFVLYPSQFAGSNQATAAEFEVENLEAVMAELRGNGVTFEEYDLPDVKTEGGVMTMEWLKGAWFKDSEGNILSISQRLK